MFREVMTVMISLLVAGRPDQKKKSKQVVDTRAWIRTIVFPGTSIVRLVDIPLNDSIWPCHFLEFDLNTGIAFTSLDKVSNVASTTEQQGGAAKSKGHGTDNSRFTSPIRTNDHIQLRARSEFAVIVCHKVTKHNLDNGAFHVPIKSTTAIIITYIVR